MSASIVSTPSRRIRLSPQSWLRLAQATPAIVLILLLIGGLARLLTLSMYEYDWLGNVASGPNTTQYVEQLASARFWAFFLRTVTVAAIATGAAVATSLMLSLLWTEIGRPLRTLLLLAAFAPILTGDITRTLGILISASGSGPLSWLVVNGSALPLIGFGIWQVLLPMSLIILLPARLSLDTTLLEAASVLGARKPALFGRIVLPHMWKSICSSFGISFAVAMAAFADPAILGRGLQPFLANYLNDQYLILSDHGAGGAIAIILIVITTFASGAFVALGRLRIKGVGR